MRVGGQYTPPCRRYSDYDDNPIRTHEFRKPRRRPFRRRTPMKTYLMADPIRYRTMTTTQLRETFLVENLFTPNEIPMVYCDVDRTIIGSAVPTNKALILGTADELRASFFLERREIGILNIGAKGTVTVDGKAYE